MPNGACEKFSMTQASLLSWENQGPHKLSVKEAVSQCLRIKWLKMTHAVWVLVRMDFRHAREP